MLALAFDQRRVKADEPDAADLVRPAPAGRCRRRPGARPRCARARTACWPHRAGRVRAAHAGTSRAYRAIARVSGSGPPKIGPFEPRLDGTRANPGNVRQDQGGDGPDGRKTLAAQLRVPGLVCDLPLDRGRRHLGRHDGGARCRDVRPRRHPDRRATGRPTRGLRSGLAGLDRARPGRAAPLPRPAAEQGEGPPGGRQAGRRDLDRHPYRVRRPGPAVGRGDPTVRARPGHHAGRPAGRLGRDQVRAGPDRQAVRVGRDRARLVRLLRARAALLRDGRGRAAAHLPGAGAGRHRGRAARPAAR